MRFGQIMLYVLIGSFMLAIVTSIGVGMWAPARMTADLLMIIMWMMAGAVLPMTICAIALDRGAPRGLCWSGVVSIGLAFPMWISVLLLQNALDETAMYRLLIAAGGLSIWSIAAGLSGVLFATPVVRAWEHWLRLVTVAVLYLLVPVVCLAFVAFVQEQQLAPGRQQEHLSLLLRVIALMVVLFAAGLVGMIIAHFERKLRGGEAAIVRRPFRVTCPRCQAAQQLETGGDACTACGLKITVTTV